MPLPAMSRTLLERGIDYQMLAHPPAETAKELAVALDHDVYDVLKVVALRGRGGFAFAVLRGIDRLDLHQARRALSDPHVRLATDDEVAETFPDFDPGCLPPVGSTLGIPTLVDPSVFDDGQVIFANARDTLAVKTSPFDLFDDPDVKVTPLRDRWPWEVGVGDASFAGASR